MTRSSVVHAATKKRRSDDATIVFELVGGVIATRVVLAEDHIAQPGLDLSDVPAGTNRANIRVPPVMLVPIPERAITLNKFVFDGDLQACSAGQGEAYGTSQETWPSG
ncbi:hypothetical protein [Bradyrhizobium sp. SYSU BS000235]|uniref:hypothetical protein n=1 Tax=Bradyrhizobium sp. SYSU BS000235 TaxID=3411332 RepID=UPI003C796B39